MQIKSHPFFACIDWAALDRREIPPPWTPAVRDATDTRNIAAEFTSEPAAVTPSPAHSKLRDMTGETPPSFTAFTFTHDSVLDGQTYRVSSYTGEGFLGGEGGEAGAVGGLAGGAGARGSSEGSAAEAGAASDVGPEAQEDVVGRMEGMRLSA